MNLDVILLGIGFAFVLEGLVWGLFPKQVISIVLELAKMNENNLRLIGLASLAIGAAIIWAGVW